MASDSYNIASWIEITHDLTVKPLFLNKFKTLILLLKQLNALLWPLNTFLLTHFSSYCNGAVS